MLKTWTDFKLLSRIHYNSDILMLRRMRSMICYAYDDRKSSSKVRLYVLHAGAETWLWIWGRETK